MAKILPQGTELFVLAPKNGGGFEVVSIDCPISIDLGEDQRDEHDDTCLPEPESRSFLLGLTTPGDTTFVVQIDPGSTSHVRLKALEGTGQKLSWAMGWSDGKTKPTPPAADGNDWTLPPDRTWSTWLGAVSTFNFSGFEVGSGPVQGSVKIKRSTKAQWLVKGAAAP